MERVKRKATEAEVALATDAAVSVTVGQSIRYLSHSQLRLDGGTQLRKTSNIEAADDYFEVMLAAGGWGPFPPVEAVMDDNGRVWLWDGFARVTAFGRLRMIDPSSPDVIPVKVRPGTLRDAIYLAASANGMHGLRRSSADKRNQVTTLLMDGEWSQMSDRQIAQHCNVSDRLVNTVRHELEATANIRSQTERKGADGRITKVGNINTARVRYTPTDEPVPDADDLPVRQLRPDVVQSSAPASRAALPALGKCARCGRPLSDPEHVANGCGPVCAAKRAANFVSAEPPKTLAEAFEGDTVSRLARTLDYRTVQALRSFASAMRDQSWGSEELEIITTWLEL